MKSTALSLLVVGGLVSTSAMAADLPIAMEPMAPAPIESVALFTWSGFYVGANVGYGWGRDDVVGVGTRPQPGAYGNIGTFDPKGWLGGVQAGFNWQMDQFVVGIEGDVQWTGVDDRIGSRNTTGGPAGFATASATTDIDWYGTLRARAGVAMDRILLYGTGGLAFGNVDYRVNVTAPAAQTIRSSDTEWGYALGAGVEFAFNENLSAKAEYMFVDLGVDETLRSANFSTVPTSQLHTVRVGLNYRFSGF